jgi:uncharacterized protein (DUF58 family)
MSQDALARRLLALAQAAADAAGPQDTIRQPPRRTGSGEVPRRRRGTGTQFWDYAPVAVGEPVERIDWKRSATSDSLYRRQHELDAARVLLLWCDGSGSMDFASAPTLLSKREQAIVLAVAFALTWLEQGNLVGVIGDERLYRGTSSGLSLVRLLLQEKRALPPPMRRSGVDWLLLVSDGLGQSADLRTALLALARQTSGGLLVHLYDPAETALTEQDACQFDDCEQGPPIDLEDPQAYAAAYLAAWQDHCAGMAAMADAAAWSFVRVSTETPVRLKQLLPS